MRESRRRLFRRIDTPDVTHPHFEGETSPWAPASPPGCEARFAGATNN